MAKQIDLIGDERLSAYGRLVETQRLLHRIFDRSLRAGAGMSIVWYEALMRLARAGEGHVPISELGEAMQLTSGGATRLVDRLEQAGYAARIPCPTDRRVSWVQLTDEGRAALAAATEVHLDDIDEHFLSQLTSAELETLRNLLRRLRPAATEGGDVHSPLTARGDA